MLKADPTEARGAAARTARIASAWARLTTWLARSARAGSRKPGRVLAGLVAHGHEDLRLVEHRPRPDAVAQRADDGVRVLGERADHRAVGPAARVLDPLREVPVEQGRVGRDAVREQLVDRRS